MKKLLILATFSVAFSVFGQSGPIQRNPFTTATNGQTIVQGAFSLDVAGNIGTRRITANESINAQPTNGSIPSVIRPNSTGNVTAFDIRDNSNTRDVLTVDTNGNVTGTSFTGYGGGLSGVPTILPPGVVTNSAGYTLIVDPSGNDVAFRTTNSFYKSVYGALQYALSGDRVQVNRGFYSEAGPGAGANILRVPQGVVLSLASGAYLYNTNTTTGAEGFVSITNGCLVEGFGTINGNGRTPLTTMGGTNFIYNVTLISTNATTTAVKGFGVVTSSANELFNTTVRGVTSIAARAFTVETGLDTNSFIMTFENCFPNTSLTPDVTGSGAGRQVGYSFGEQNSGSRITIKGGTITMNDAGSGNPSYAVYYKPSSPDNDSNAMIVADVKITHTYTNTTSADFYGYGTNTIGIANITCSDGRPPVITNVTPYLNPVYYIAQNANNPTNTAQIYTVGTIVGDGSGLTNLQGEISYYSTNATLANATTLVINFLPFTDLTTNYVITSPNDLIGVTTSAKTPTNFTLNFTLATLTSQIIEGGVIHK